MIRTILIVLCLFYIGSIRCLSIGKRSFCGGGNTTLTHDNGVITSHAGLLHNHTYGRYLDCSWTVEAPAEMKVQLIAKTFDLEDDWTCDHDYIILYDGRDNRSTSLGKFCGSSFNPVISSGRFLTLRFITDGQTQRRGFQMYYNFTSETLNNVCGANQFQCANNQCISSMYRCDNTDDCGDDSDETNCQGYTHPTCASDEFSCGNQQSCVPKHWLCDGDDDCNNGADENAVNCALALADSKCGQLRRSGWSGNITSPGYPDKYFTGLRCIYYIIGPSGTRNLTFKFDTHFDVDSRDSCAWDYVLVYSDDKANRHGPFCGSKAPAAITIPGNHAYVEFNSDSDHNFYSKGFRLDWKAYGKHG